MSALGSKDNLANVLGAFVGALGDEVVRSAEQGAINVVEAAALVHISKYPGCRIDELRAPTAVTHSGSVRIVNRLVDQGMLERRAGDDARSVGLHLTRKGRREVDEVLARRARGLVGALVPLTEAEQAELGRLISKMLTARITSPADALRCCRLCDYSVCTVCPVSDAFAPDGKAG